MEIGDLDVTVAVNLVVLLKGVRAPLKGLGRRGVDMGKFGADPYQNYA